MRYILFLIIVLLLVSCKNEPEVMSLSADEIINKSIETSGGSVFDSSAVIIKFDFRDIFYKSTFTPETRVLSRLIVKEQDSILDFLKGEMFQRYINEKAIIVEDSMVKKYSASVNSVHYFSTLPYGLNDKAVNKELIGEERIKEKYYYKIKVTFDEEGGGEDFEDIFIYWIDKQLFKIDYLAYSYNEDDGVGMRFREAYNERYINGLRFVDYNNYKAEKDATTLLDLGKAFENNQLKLLSKIELENVKVDLIDL
ncbi:deoxyribose-phosphate aldolase [Flavobacteriales bacterium ALC-1]|nr:deoxyribose-phosphate aldolase [Flavobacteriales bacterium ALC-1]